MIYEALSFKTDGQTDVINITETLQTLVNRNQIQEGLLVATVQGSTAALTTIEYEPNLIDDLRIILNELIPEKREYRHHLTWGDDNGHSHLRASIFGPSISLIIQNGRLLLGSWQQVVLIDFDTRPRQRVVHVAILDDN